MTTMSRRRATLGAGMAALLAGLSLWPAAAQATAPMRYQARLLAQASIADSMNIKTTKPSALQLVTITIQPGGNGGWHSHDAFVLVAVKRGTATFYDGDDPTCTPHYYPAGTGVTENAGPSHVHITRNEGAVPLVYDVVVIVPAGGSAVLDKPRPGNCPF